MDLIMIHHHHHYYYYDNIILLISYGCNDIDEGLMIIWRIAL